MHLICFQKSNHKSFSSFRIPGFSAVRSDRTHSRSSIFSCNPHASDGVIIFVRLGLFFSELSTSSLFLCLHVHVHVNISLQNSCLLYFLNDYASPVCSSSINGKTDSFSSSIFLSCRNFLILGTSTAISLFWIQKVLRAPVERKYSIG